MIESLKKNKIGILLMVISSISVCVGQLFWKLSYSKGIIFLLIGFGLYILGALIMLIAYKFGSLSVLQPVLSLNYVISIFLAFFLLNEAISLLKVLGIMIITIGVLFICAGD